MYYDYKQIKYWKNETYTGCVKKNWPPKKILYYCTIFGQFSMKLFSTIKGPISHINAKFEVNMSTNVEDMLIFVQQPPIL